MEGDGIGSIEWGGSTNVEAVSYHNPVWEPSLEGGTLVVTSTNFVAIGGETQWAVGVDYCCPSIYSSTSMIWETNQQVSFTAANRPKWNREKMACPDRIGQKILISFSQGIDPCLCVNIPPTV